jgi:polyhydroxyalkanoate synthase
MANATVIEAARVSSAEPAAIAVDAAESLDGGEAVGLPSVEGLLDGLGAVLSQGRVVGREGVALAGELVRVAVGKSELAPGKGDHRFADPAWTTNPVFRRIQQCYLAGGAALARVVDSLAEASTDNHRVERARLATQIVTAAAAPTNFLMTNPAAIKRAFDTAGLSLARGARHLVSDMRHNGGMPSTVDRDVLGGPGSRAQSGRRG